MGTEMEGERKRAFSLYFGISLHGLNLKAHRQAIL